MVSFDIDKLNKLLNSLKGIPNIKEVRSLRKRLQKEQTKLIPKPKQLPSPAELKTLANTQRSSKLSRYWRYVRLIRDNFPDLTVAKIRSQLTKRQQGQEVDIPDAVWQNPSP